MDIHIVGGSYREICHWPNHDIVMGSGGRAARVIAELLQTEGTHLHSLLPSEFEINLKQHFALVDCKFHIENVEELVTFKYDHPLSIPEIYPPRSVLEQQSFSISIKEDNVLVFGMVESEIDVDAKKLVYDPQDQVCIKTLEDRQFKAEAISLVLNHSEATSFYKKLQGTDSCDLSVEQLADALLEEQSVAAIVIKSGHRGAFAKARDTNGEWVSAYRTENIFPIGSGDCFAAAFSYYWCIAEETVITAAKYASIVAAFYCETKTYVSATNVPILMEEYNSLPSTNRDGKLVYLAGPFFSLKELWMVNQVRAALCNIGLDVFSPYHDVGVGTAEEVVSKDIEGIKKADVIYALFDGHDPGTLFEIGYAVKLGIPVVIYAETSSNEHLKMYEGMGCVICTDFSTSIYQTSWALL